MVMASIESDILAAQSLLSQNSRRITHTVSLITSFMSVQSSFASLHLNERLGFLTGLATFMLPLNIIAAIMAIQGDYGPGGGQFWIFWVSGIAACVAFFVLFGVLSLGF